MTFVEKIIIAASTGVILAQLIGAGIIHYRINTISKAHNPRSFGERHQNLPANYKPINLTVIPAKYKGYTNYNITY